MSSSSSVSSASTFSNFRLKSTLELISMSIDDITSYLTSKNMELKNIGNGLFMIHFTDTSDSTDSEINFLKGLIFNHEKKEIRSLTPPVVVNYNKLTPLNKESILIQICHTFGEYPITVSSIVDGALLRYAYFPEFGKWMLSTNKRLDASTAVWMKHTNLTFQQMFEEALANMGVSLDHRLLDPDYVYMFYLQHPANSGVMSMSGESRVYHISTYSRMTMMPNNYINIGIPRLEEESRTFNNINELLSSLEMEKEAQPVTTQNSGYILTLPNSDQRIRFESTLYERANEICGNTNNLSYRVLQLYTSGQLNEFLSFFPKYSTMITDFLYDVTDLVDKLFEDYRKKYMLKQVVQFHSRLAKFIYRIQDELYFKELRPKGEKIDKEKIKNFLLSQDVNLIYYLLQWKENKDNLCKFQI